MKLIYKLFIITFLLTCSSTAFSKVSLNIRIGKILNNKLIEINKNIMGDYNKEIVVQDDALKDKLVLSLRKIKNVIVNGKKSNPVQVNLKAFDKLTNNSSATHTVTSFYNNEAKFKVATTANIEDHFDIDLEFTEVN